MTKITFTWPNHPDTDPDLIGTQLTWIYNPKYDGPINVYKRNPNYVVTETVA